MGDTPKVYAAISAVTHTLCKEGITKNRKNAQQGYNFRGIDDLYNALAPALVESKLVMLPRILSRAFAEHPTKAGGTLFYVTVEAEFDLVSTEDGSKHTIRTYGEAMDSGDKATNKAMSAAYKYAAMQAFSIPTEGDNDADAQTPQPAPKVASVTGEIVKKKPEWSAEQKAEAGAMRQAIICIDAAGDKEVLDLTKRMAYDQPADVIDAMAVLLRKWQDIDSQGKK